MAMGDMWTGRSRPSGAPQGMELRLPALVQPDVLLDLVESLGALSDAATKWFLYWDCGEKKVIRNQCEMGDNST